MATIETIDASTPTIFVRRSAATISDAALYGLREITGPQSRTSDCLRSWLRGCVDAELSRRNSPDAELEEPPVWALPWHSFTDSELAASLAAVYTWRGLPVSFDTDRVLDEVTRSVMTACCTRLLEIHEAIEIARAKRGK